jgi:purine-binding chemotaxis protein CheW
MRFLLFLIDDARYAVRADAVAEIVRAVAVNPLPNAPAVIEGLIDVRGELAPVFDLRRRFGSTSRPVDIADHFILVRATNRLAALHVDRVLDLADVPDADVSRVADYVSQADHVAGVATLPDGLALIHDVDAFLSAAEADSLDAAIAAAASTADA